MSIDTDTRTAQGRRIGGYRGLLAGPGAPSLAAYGLIGRLAAGMLGIGTVMLVARATGSYATAGAAAAAGVLAGAAASPQLGRLADRIGHTRALCLALPAHALGVISLIAAAHGRAPAWVLCVCAGLGGGALPPFGSLVRAHWTHRLAGSPALQRAYALETVFDELAWIVGPVAVAVLATTFNPSTAMLACVLCALIGGCGLARRHSAADAGRSRAESSPLHIPRLRAVLVINTVIGMAFGANDLSVVAMAGQDHVLWAGGPIIAVYSVGSILTGAAYGRTTWRGRASRRHALFALAFAAAFAPLALTPSAAWIAAAALVAGAACAPILISGNALVEHCVPGPSVTEALAWTTSAILVGSAAGSWLAGHLIARGGAHAGLMLTAGCAAAVPAACALLGPSRIFTVNRRLS